MTHRVILWNLHHKSKTKTEGWQKQREMIPLSYKTNTITTNKANHRSVFANSGKHTNFREKTNFIKSFTKFEFSRFRISGHRSIPLRFSSLCRASRRPYPVRWGTTNLGPKKLRVHNSTSMKIYQNSVINYENYCTNSWKFTVIS